jgi:hypothetical protein
LARNLLSNDTSTSRRKQTTIDALYIRSNVVSIGSGATSVTVTFSVALPDANYTISPSLKNVVDGSPQYQPLEIIAQSASAFTIGLNAATDSASYVLQYQTMGIV